MNYTEEQMFLRSNLGPSPSDICESDQLNDFVTVDSSVYFDMEDRFRLTLAVTNLFDRTGEDYFGNLTSFNETLGRRSSAS